MLFNDVSAKFSRSIKILLILSLAPMVLSGCDMTHNALKNDREGHMEFQDYRDAFASRVDDDAEEQKTKQAAIPNLQPYIASGSMNAKPMPLVSISVNQTVPLRDLLFELAQQADVDIELDPSIRGGIIFTARQRPFDQVIERIADIAGLRYSLENDVLRIEQDTPYNKLYKIDYLSYVRTNSSQISNDISVVSGEGTDTGSNFSTTAESESNFWAELESNIQQIIGGPIVALRTNADPQISVADQNPNVQPVVASGDGSVQVSAPEAVLNVSSLPVDSSDSSEGGGEEATEPSFAINKQAGLINVFASGKAHKQIQDYLDLVKRSVTSQVLIEAKILEVTLSDDYETGINWDLIGLPDEFGVSFQTSAVTPTNTAFAASFAGNDVDAAIQAISRFGTVKALASPRVTVLNNQSAIMNVATNRVFFEVSIETTVDEGVSNTEVESEIRNVPEGVLINVQPSIDLSNQTIAMAVRPTITRIVGTINDPGVAFQTASCGAPCDGIVSGIPELNVQEVDSVIKVRSGEPIVMGGLLQDRVETDNAGVPILSETPLIGNMFKNKNDSISKTELVIFLKASILEKPSDSIFKADKDLYRQFSGDRRPLNF